MFPAQRSLVGVVGVARKTGQDSPFQTANSKLTQGPYSERTFSNQNVCM